MKWGLTLALFGGESVSIIFISRRGTKRPDSLAESIVWEGLARPSTQSQRGDSANFPRETSREKPIVLLRGQIKESRINEVRLYIEKNRSTE